LWNEVQGKTAWEKTTAGTTASIVSRLFRAVVALLFNKTEVEYLQIGTFVLRKYGSHTRIRIGLIDFHKLKVNGTAYCS
jgi:hypothetical protein